MGRNYKFYNPDGVYFVSFAVVKWLDVFTRNEYKNIIIENPKESRKEFLLEQFLKAGSKSSNVNVYQFWRHDNKPIELWSNKVIDEKIDYIHENPVEEGIIFRAENYLYSSAIDYAGEPGILNDVIVVK